MNGVGFDRFAVDFVKWTDICVLPFFFFLFLYDSQRKQETGRDLNDIEEDKKKNKRARGKRERGQDLMEIKANRTAQAQVSAAGLVSSRLVSPPQMGCFTGGVVPTEVHALQF